MSTNLTLVYWETKQILRLLICLQLRRIDLGLNDVYIGFHVRTFYDVNVFGRYLGFDSLNKTKNKNVCVINPWLNIIFHSELVGYSMISVLHQPALPKIPEFYFLNAV